MKFTKVIWAPLLIFAMSGAAAKAAEIVTHEAKYTLSLQKLRIKGTPKRSGGTMELKFSRDCFHWWVDRELKFEVRFADGRFTKLVVVERLRETLSGKLFWFWSRTTLNGQTASIIAGSASRPDENEMVDVEPPKPGPTDKDSATTVEASATGAKDKATKTPVAAGAANAAEKNKKPDTVAKKKQRQLGVRINYDWPNDTDIELSPDVIFPVTALRQQLDALAAGALLRQQSVFDGSRKKGAARVVYSKINPVAIVTATLPNGDTRLLDGKSWRFKARYLPLEGAKSAKPFQTVTRKVHANGIVSEILRDLGPFSINGNLNWIKELPLPTCE